ncbi:MAG: hypothetical protein WCL54_03320, partial [Clostridia bacterium]
MKKVARILVLVFMVTMLFAQYVAPVQVAAATDPLVYDGFNYSPGPLLTQNGGTGWASMYESSVYYSGGKQAACVSGGNEPLSYFDGSNYLVTTGNDLAMSNAYVAIQRPLDTRPTGVLSSYVFYTPQPNPTGTPYPAANTYQIGKQGTKIWGSFLQSIGSPGGWDTETRAMYLHNSTTTNGFYQQKFYKISFGYFGAASRLSGAGVGYMTMRINMPSNPGTYSTTNNGDAIWYDSAPTADNRFLYVRMTSAPLTLLYATYFTAYSIEYTTTDTIINAYINPTLGATEPVTPTATFSVPLNINNMYIKGINYAGSMTLAKNFFDEFRMGANFESVCPFQATLPQPTAAPASMGPKIPASAFASPSVGEYNASGADYLIDGIINDNSKMAGASNVARLGYYNLPLKLYRYIGMIKVFAGETGATQRNVMPSAYYISYFNGTTWDMVPETNIWGGRDGERTFVLANPIFTNAIRLCNNTPGSPKFREVELYEPATITTISSNTYTTGTEVMVDEFSSIDYSKWSIVGATPNPAAVPTPWSYGSPTPAPAPVYAPYITSDSQASPLPWLQVAVVSPMPTTGPWRSDFYAADGSALVLTAATAAPGNTTGFYAFRSTATIPTNFLFDTRLKISHVANNMSYIYFNESGTNASGAATNGYRLEISSNVTTNNFTVNLQKMVNGTPYFLSNSVTCNRGHYYMTFRVMVKDGNIKVW